MITLIATYVEAGGFIWCDDPDCMCFHETITGEPVGDWVEWLEDMRTELDR